jgi:RNA 3'-terminal phosphate cyclase (ATP)
MIEIDGSQGEGGGQILRTSLALSLITGKPFRMTNIRAKRPKPGLMRQHLACVLAAQSITGGSQAARVENGAGAAPGIGDVDLKFVPGEVRAGHYEFAVGSAGSCALVLQTVLWPLVMASEDSSLLLRGGTHNPMAPSFTFLELMAPYFSGGQETYFKCDLRRHGFYPAGGGEVAVNVYGRGGSVRPINLIERGRLLKSCAIALHAGIPKSVASRELEVLRTGLGWGESQLLDRALRANEGPGNALMAVLEYEHCAEMVSGYAERGLSAEKLAQAVCDEVRRYQSSHAPVGPHLADQLMIAMALAARGGEKSQAWATEATQHTLTNAEVIEKFLPCKFSLTERGDGVLISCS